LPIRRASPPVVRRDADAADRREGLREGRATMPADRAARPNVLLVTADQWPGGLLGCAGHPTIQTPTLDQLARNGVRYTRAYSESPICIPARRTLLTGTDTRTHGDRVFNTAGTWPHHLTSLPQAFRDAGYQAHAVGKLHVYPPRDRIGFDEVLLAEEGRPHLGATDDYELFLADRGFVGQQFAGGMNNNNYLHRPWHLPEECHVTNWETQTMCRQIKRRDPTRPNFWFLSYTPPHPPLTPLADYMDYYRQFEPPPALRAAWSDDADALPRALVMGRNFWPPLAADVLREVRRAFYALCTHIDHQFRLVLGTLREEGLLDDTIILFTADHGDMLGDHGLYAKRLFYEGSARVPLILMGAAGDQRVPAGTVDDRLVGLADVMPTLLELTGVPLPPTVVGQSMLGESRRQFLYGDCLDDHAATRMLHDGRHKLIWYPAGNRVQLFDLAADPHELRDVAAEPASAAVRATLTARLADAAWGRDVAQGWVRDGALVGYDPGPYQPKPDRSWSGQRGLHFPAPPQLAPDRMVGFPQ
jgi:arylsulfatase A-like enzyme